MRHIKNSDKDGIYILVHPGVPNSTTTEYGELITEGSLCIDYTYKELYILKNGIWQKYGVGFNGDAYIPLDGTAFNKPVTGDIEFANGISTYSGSSRITHYQNNVNIDSNIKRLNIGDNIIYSSKNTPLIDSLSKSNFITSLLDNNLTMTNSYSNKVFMSIDGVNATISNSNNNTINGRFIGGVLQFINNNTNSFRFNFNDISSIDTVDISSNIDSDISLLNINSGFDTLILNNNALYTNISSFSNSQINTVYKSYITGVMNDSIIQSSNNINTNAHLINTEIKNSTYTNIFGGIIANSSIELSSHNTILTSSNILNMNDVRYSVILGDVSNMDLDNIENNIIINTDGYDIVNAGLGSTSDYNTVLQSKSTVASLIKGNNNFLSNIQNINKTNNIQQFDYNIVFYTDSIIFDSLTTTATSNIIIAKDFNSTVGSNNLIIHNGTTNNVFGKYNFLYGDISLAPGININDGNIILGNNTVNSTITSNNIILGAKNLTNINHNSQDENIILNVDNFLVDDTRTVYLPNTINMVNNGYISKFNANNTTQNNTYYLPNSSGTIALLSDIGAGSDPNAIKRDGTSVTTASIPFAEGLILPNTKLIRNVASTASLVFGDDIATLDTTNVRLNVGSSPSLYGFNLGHKNTTYINLYATQGFGVGDGYGFGFRVNSGIGLDISGTNTVGNVSLSLSTSMLHGLFIIQSIPNTNVTHNYLDIRYNTNVISLTNSNTRIALDLSIGANTPDTTTTLDLQSTTKGVGLPVVTTLPDASRKGNFVYDNADNLRYSDGVNWRTLATVSATTASAVAYVLYNSVNAASSDTSVSVKGDGSILLPYCSLHYALTKMTNTNDKKSVIVMDSGEKEYLPLNESYTWNKSITLNFGVYIIATTALPTGTEPSIVLPPSNGQSTDPLTYLFNAGSGFSLNGGGTLALWNKGLVNMTGDVNVSYVIDGVTILFNQRLINKTSNSLLDVDKTKFYHSNNYETIVTGAYNAYVERDTYCDLCYVGSNYARLNLTRCIFNNTLLSVNTLNGYGVVADSSFYAAGNYTFSYITFNSIDDARYNYTSRNNSFDLVKNNKRTAFKVLSNNCVSIGDRIIGCASGAADMISIEKSYDTKVVATTDITLSGLQTIDGVTLVANDRVLLVGQTDKKQNGIYTVSTTGLTRTTDSLTGLHVDVTHGTVCAETIWKNDNTSINIGVDDIAYYQMGLYCYTLYTPSTSHNGVPMINTSTFVATTTGLTIA